MRATKFWRVFGLSLLISAGGLSVAAADDYKNPATAQLNLKLTIAEGCHLDNEDTGTTIVFPQVSNLDNPKEQRGHFSIKCTAGYSGNKSLKVTLSAGEQPGDTIANRKLHFESDPTSTLDFQVFIYKNGAAGEIWGDGTQGSSPIEVDLAANGANLVGSGDYVVRLLKQSLEGKYAGNYSSTLQMAISYQ